MGTKSKFYKRKSESGLAAPTKNLQVTSNETTARIFNSVRDFSDPFAKQKVASELYRSILKMWELPP
ncbi:hypothetical protein LEP1GSC132_1532 [Leptospira kirschneri str. 200803703]|uniref:Uncharacterized protein n=2 Tax=Leptospira kirschneri TaxID=29507 RepID=A0A828Y500_9LEPT|nr:hypothetical protein [Leptospira kirschneri]EKO49660.1 hypothetical protein LEP1GSC131_4100 [Leptospira kirschneri str. 200802841]EMN27731.1 hypothetical protein LEP1GSC065_0851 [Leptospira kirschneri serovar Sokoine str. RM1]EMO69173.1 hypothetical protein LEP1GSC132_1532 [Leptospira kirschneri str. 200803703]EMO78234.1 hypothetical protein LEP1GSC127_0314 [Leptospira kirschneri str. 200801925]EPG48432.1 hypothetical protein LEP1GSC049_3874 [Leptospira kirschneri serovar Cynopteri str. 352